MDAVFEVVQLTSRIAPVQHLSLFEKINIEITNYLNEKTLGKNDSPLLYWKTHVEQFPFLTAAARNVLHAQPTNCSSERTNSVGSTIISDLRHSLSDYNAEALIFSKKNRDLFLAHC